MIATAAEIDALRSARPLRPAPVLDMFDTLTCPTPACRVESFARADAGRCPACGAAGRESWDKPYLG